MKYCKKKVLFNKYYRDEIRAVAENDEQNSGQSKSKDLDEETKSGGEKGTSNISDE